MIQCPAGEPIMRSSHAGALKAMNEKDERMECAEKHLTSEIKIVL